MVPLLVGEKCDRCVGKAVHLPNHIDALFADHGSTCLITPVSTKAREWLEEHLPMVSWLGEGLVVAPRYLDEVLSGMQAAGFVMVHVVIGLRGNLR